jgi:hypothetical protein
METTMKTVLGIAIGAVVGGLIGYSQVLCAGGQCVITGSWYGGAILGGLVGMFLTGGCPACATTRCEPRSPQTRPDEPDDLKS